MTMDHDDRPPINKHRQSAEEISEARSHADGVASDEDASHNLPNFFSITAIFDIITGGSKPRKCPRCNSSSMGHELSCPKCGYVDRGAITSFLIIGGACLVVPFFAWSTNNLILKWGCAGCGFPMGLFFFAIGLDSIIKACKAKKAAR